MDWTQNAEFWMRLGYFNQSRDGVCLNPGILVQQENKVGAVVQSITDTDIVRTAKTKILVRFD